MNLEQFASRGLKAQAAVDDLIARSAKAQSAGDNRVVEPKQEDRPMLRLLEGPDWDELKEAGKTAGAPRQAMRPRSLNPTPLINRAAVKDKLLQLAGKERHHKWTRVSSDALQEINDAALRACVNLVHRLPSKGKTI